jgi:hypothetical protein
MAINISDAGTTGTHSFRKVNVNAEENYIYYKDSDIPASIVDGASYIYNDGVGSVDGISEGELVYADVVSSTVLKFINTSDLEVDITGSAAGTVLLNTPVVYDNKLNIGSSTSSNQAVKYYTSGTPLTGLVSGNTYFLKNVEADFTGTQALYTITGDTHTFTTAGITGRVGPTISEARTAYTGATAWSGTYLQQGSFLGYQD